MKSLKEVLKTVSNTATFLFSKIKEVNQRNPLGDTPLHVVTRWGDAEAALILITAGAEIDAIGEYGQTPLFGAIGSRSIETIEILLIHGADMHTKDDSNKTAIEYAKSVLSVEDFNHLFSAK